MIEFFMAMRIPTTTHQMHKVSKSSGKIRFYEPQELRDARNKFRAYLGKYRPGKPLRGALRLSTKWLFPPGKSHKPNTWKTTRPDTDNLIKLLRDCMTAEGFWQDDAQVASELTEKFYGEHEGIYVRVEEMENGKG